MHEQYKILEDRINQVYRRWKRLILLKGGAITLFAGIGAFLLAFTLDSIFELTIPVRLLLLAGILAVTLTTLYLKLIRPLLNAPTETQLARYVEEKYTELEDRLVSAVELGGGENPRISNTILERLLEDTRFHIEPLNLPKTIHARGAAFWAMLTLAVTAILVGLIFSHGDFFSSQWGRILTPWKIPNIIKQSKLIVTPGDARVPRGSTQDIRAQIQNFDTDQVFLYYTFSDSSWEKAEMDRTEQASIFVYNFNIQGETKYYVKADEFLSKIYTFTVYEAPQIKRVDLTYIYPEYTGLNPKTEFDTGDVWAPEGTQVKVKATSDKRLRKAEIVLGENFRLKTSISSDTLLTASFTVTQDTYYKIHITDTDGLANDPPPEYYVHALPDQPPVLSLEKPGVDKKASMVEEVPLKVQILDDFGLSHLKLFYTVNGEEEKEISLSVNASPVGPLSNGASPIKRQETGFGELREFTAEHLFYLEDLGVQPGDFLTYHVEAQDNRISAETQKVSSDIFFIEIRPFEREFLQPLSQGEMWGARGLGLNLSGIQKEIIVATWKLQRKQEKLTPEQWQQDMEVIIESQNNLKEITQNALFQMRQRSLFTGESDSDITRYYTEAVQAMERALVELKARRLKEALTPEREAYQNLLRAEAQIKEYQMQRAQGQGPAGPASLDELAQLFEDEMDKLKNKYETLQQNQRRDLNEELNEALQKIKELARRQQEFNQRTRDLARKQLTQEDKKRRIEELRRQQEQLQRETQELNRQIQELQRQGGNLPRDIQNNLRQASSEMNQASSDLLREKSELAAAQGGRALNSLKRLEESLRRNLNQSLRHEFESLEQEFQKLAEAQKQLVQEVEKLTQEKDVGLTSNVLNEKLQKAQENHKQIKEDLTEAQGDLQSLARIARESKHEVSRELEKMSREMAGKKLDEKMENAQKLLQENRLNSALQAERDIQTVLDEASAKLTQLRGQFAETEEEKLDLALAQTQRLRESLTHQSRGLNTEESAKSGEPITSQKRAENFRAGPGETGAPPQKLDPQQIERWNETLAQWWQDLESIGESVKVDTSLYRELSQIRENLGDILRNFGGGDPSKLELIQQKILDPLKNFETALAQKLEILRNKEKLFLARDEKIPPEYEELVQKYYEALSKTK